MVTTTTIICFLQNLQPRQGLAGTVHLQAPPCGWDSAAGPQDPLRDGSHVAGKLVLAPVPSTWASPQGRSHFLREWGLGAKSERPKEEEREVALDLPEPGD